MGDVVIKLENVSKFYKLYDSHRDRLKESLNPFRKVYHKEFYALKKINLEVKKGEILGIVGKNGSGKSTLLKLISGILVPNDGKVMVSGNISALLELGSGFNPDFTGLENIFFYGSILGFSRKDMDAKLDDIIEFAEIGDFINQPVKSYSSGMKARLSFAVAVHIDPEILILDEVLSVGDVLFQRKCYAKMDEFFKGGKTILYVSHNADTVNQLCTRAILLHEGGITMDAPPKAVTAYYQKLLFSSNTLSSNHNQNDSDDVGSVSDENINKQFLPHKTNYIPGLVAKSRVEYKNEDVSIMNAMIIDEFGAIVNLLELGGKYQFLVDIEFGVNAKDVAFGLEIKDIKGVRLATVESARLYKKGFCYEVCEGDLYKLKYSFKCIFNTGTYFINCGVSSFDGEQRVLNKIVDVLVFKANNADGFTGGYLELVESVEIDKYRNGTKDTIEIHKNE